jgi:hypothetical protein
MSQLVRYDPPETPPEILAPSHRQIEDPVREDVRPWLVDNSAFAGIDAVKNRRFVTVNFSDATPGIRNIAAARKIAETLYPERCKPGEARDTSK